MILLPATVTPELAEAASRCVTLVQARKLAEWVGAGKPLTPSGVLKPALAVEACGLLGIEVPPGRLRTALDLDELMLIWDAACSAGYMIPRGSRVRATPRLTDTSPGQTVQSWLNLMSAGLGLREGPCGGCLTVLHELSLAGGPLDLAQLAEAVRSLAPSEGEDGPCPDCGEVHGPADLTFMIGGDQDEDLDDSAEHAEDVVAFLVSHGAAAVLEIPEAPGEVRAELTPLGRMLAESLFTGCAPPAEADAATLMDVLCVVPPKIASQMAMPWLAARSPAAAVRELLAYAESADPDQRVIAVTVASGLGPQAAPAWRDWADRPGFGAYARMWLTEQGEQVSPDPADQAWLAADALRAVGVETAEETVTIEIIPPTEIPPVTRRVRLPRLPAGEAYQLKVTLRGVSKPPVWRRIVVPAALPLSLLHHVLQQAMGWGDDHLHVFSASGRDYGDAYSDLGFADESKAVLAKILAKPGAAMRYTYDFGDEWEHDIVLEKVLPPDPVPRLSCLAGKGACPPEDCGGAWGYASLKEVLADPGHEDHLDLLEWLGLDEPADFDPAWFGLDEVNARLGQLL
jgi:Plasmid pRiA4b ORF-3-like protein